MASDFHIKFDGVDGESLSKGHEKAIEVLNWNWSVNNEVDLSGSGSGSGKGEVGEFTFTHKYSKASPILAKHCAGGKHFDTVKFTARKAGGDEQKDFLVITMKVAFITKISSSGSGGGDLYETIACASKDIEFDYKPQDDKGGLGGSIKAGINVSTMAIR
jgi:type VI secretion system secreted protein Hcp